MGVVVVTQGSTQQVITVAAIQGSGSSFSPPSGTGFIHVTAGVMDAAARAVNLATADITGVLPYANLPFGSPTTSGQVPIATGAGAAAWAILGPGSFAAGTADQLFDTNHAGTVAEWFTVGGDLTYASHSFTVIALQGRSVSSSAPSTGNTLGWSGTAWAPSALNLAGGANYVTGALPVANVAFGAAGQFLVTNSGATAAVWASVSGDIAASTATVGQLNVQSITPTGGTSTIVPFNAGGLKLSTTPWVLQDSGAVQRFSLETAHGRGTFGGGGSDTSVVIGPLVGSEGTYSAAWYLAHGVTPIATNWNFAGDGTNAYYNAAAGGFHRWTINGNPIAQLDGGTLTLEMGTTPLIQAGTSATSLTIGTNKAAASLLLNADANQNFVTLANTGVTIGFGAVASSGSGNSLTITGQGASGTGNGGAIVLTGGSASGTSSADGTVKVTTPLSCGYTTVAAATTVNLTNAQSNANFVKVTGTFSGAVALNFLREIADTSWVIVDNASSNGLITVSYISGGTVGTISPGNTWIIVSDGANLQHFATPV